jgi:hypothetical protein
MKALELNILNRLAPYEVELRDGEYYFHTDFDIVYSAEFKYEPAFGGTPAYWFDLTNRSGKASPNDPKVRDTVIRIIIEFFRANPDILLYMCDNANDQQAQRNRLFLRWFMGEEQSKHYVIKTAVVEDEGMENFIAIIVPRIHPYMNEAIAYFDAEIEMFKSNKP